MRKLAWTALLAVAGSTTAQAAVIIDWTDASVVINVIDPQNATVTGNTTGDVITPFLVTITTATTNQEVTFTGPLGNVAVPLNLNLPATRQATTLMSVDIAIPGYLMTDVTFNLLDIDSAASVDPPFSSWQDQVTFSGTGLSFTPVVPARYSIVGNQITAILGPNIANDSPDANLLVTQVGSVASIAYVYGPGPQDELGQNQRHGVSAITIDSLEAIPEPSAVVLMGVAGGLLPLGWWRRRRKAKALAA